MEKNNDQSELTAADPTTEKHSEICTPKAADAGDEEYNEWRLRRDRENIEDQRRREVLLLQSRSQASKMWWATSVIAIAIAVGVLIFSSLL